MRFVIFTQSLLSDWNHGNAHFLRGICSELIQRGHSLEVYEPQNSWSRENLIASQGLQALDDFPRQYPGLHSTIYDEASFDFNTALRDVDTVLVHEWNTPELIAAVGAHRSRNHYRLLFHDTHHRGVSEHDAIARLDLSQYDGVLAYGEVLRRMYLENGWTKSAWTWHEAADIRRFRPVDREKQGDLIWIGNWGDDERAETLREYLIRPVKKLGLHAVVYGVRYPREAVDEMEDAGIEYRGWLPNYCVPEMFARFRVTLHVPRRPYMEALPGIPTIRPFEALACGIPLICAPWIDSERMFRTDSDLLYARSEAEMCRQIDDVLSNDSVAECLAANGLETIRQRHTCAHRVDELLEIAQ